MRKTLLGGGALAVGGALIVLLGSAMGLETESVALLGAAIGGVVALVPDRTPFARLGGFAAGFVVAWVGYAVRAAALPDSSGGRAAAVFLVVAFCVAIAVVSRGRLPLWTLLLGTAALAGGYEFTFAAAPPEMVATSLNTATTMFLAVAVGFLAGSIADEGGQADGVRPRNVDAKPTEDSERVTLDKMMEKNK